MGGRVLPGEIIEILQVRPNDIRGTGRVVRTKYEVLKVFPHHVLCRKVKGGWRECFTWNQLYQEGVVGVGEPQLKENDNV